MTKNRQFLHTWMLNHQCLNNCHCSSLIFVQCFASDFWIIGSHLKKKVFRENIISQIDLNSNRSCKLFWNNFSLQVFASSGENPSIIHIMDCQFFSNIMHLTLTQVFAVEFDLISHVINIIQIFPGRRLKVEQLSQLWQDRSRDQSQKVQLIGRSSFIITWLLITQTCLKKWCL